MLIIPRNHKQEWFEQYTSCVAKKILEVQEQEAIEENGAESSKSAEMQTFHQCPGMLYSPALPLSGAVRWIIASWIGQGQRKATLPTYCMTCSIY